MAALESPHYGKFTVYPNETSLSKWYNGALYEMRVSCPQNYFGGYQKQKAHQGTKWESMLIKNMTFWFVLTNFHRVSSKGDMHQFKYLWNKKL